MHRRRRPSRFDLSPEFFSTDGSLTEEGRARIDAHIAERRKDTEFMDRLDRRLEENRPILERLREGGD